MIIAELEDMTQHTIDIPGLLEYCARGLMMKINLNDQPRTIRSVAVVTATGAEVYMLGKIIDGRTVSRISVADISIDGDRYMHYCGFDAEDELIFIVNPHAPCVVEYAS